MEDSFPLPPSPLSSSLCLSPSLSHRWEHEVTDAAEPQGMWGRCACLCKSTAKASGCVVWGWGLCHTLTAVALHPRTSLPKAQSQFFTTDGKVWPDPTLGKSRWNKAGVCIST